MKRVLACLAVAGLFLLPAVEGSARSCGAKDVKRILRTFAKEYNAGNLERSDRLFTKGTSFRSYDVHPIERPDGSDRSTLTDYFAERHSFNDVMTLTGIRAARYDNGNRGFGFSLELSRSSDELSPFASGEFSVKGSATCNGVYFWNMTWGGP